MAETIISRFFANADRLGAQPCYWFPVGDAYVPMGWRTAARLAREFAAGLISLGQEKGDALAIQSATRREWALADLGNMAAGGVTVGVYPTMTADQGRYVIAHCDAKFLVVENVKQLAKIDVVRGQLPRLQTIILIDPTGCQLGRGRITLQELLVLGRARLADDRTEGRDEVAERVASLSPEDACTFIYTSGTTGPPKGAMLTHGNIASALEMLDCLQILPTDTGFSFLPLAHALQRMVNFRGLWVGIPGAFARSLDTVSEDLGRARPSVVAAVPRIFEKVYAKVHEQAAAGSPTKKKIFDWALGVGRQVSKLRQGHQPIPPALELQHRVARRLVFDKLRAKLGGRIRVFITGGAPIAREILEFFDAADITILEGWGMTETCASGTINLPGASRFGSIGRPLAGQEMRLDDDGEILIRGPNVFSGYYKEEEATRSSFTADGYFRTGDIGKIDADGFYHIVDRKKDIIITAAGKNIAPQNIENLLKTDPRISNVMAIGDRKPYLVALIAVTPELRAGKSETDLVKLVEEIVRARNEELASYERIKKFRLLPADLTQEAGELTPTLKLKRKVVAEKYATLIDEMYADRPGERQVTTGA